MRYNNLHRINWASLHNCAIKNLSQVVAVTSIASLFKIVVQRNIKQRQLDPKRAEITV